jgi:oligopeptide/dipeptide ABC transporter ATP-binding protein
MYLGAIVETGPSQAVFDRPEHPYTRALMSAVPALDPSARRPRRMMSGEPQSPIGLHANACRFHGRCPEAIERCGREAPVSRESPGGDHRAACLFAFGASTVVGAAGR